MKTISQALSRTGFALVMISNTTLVCAQNMVSEIARQKWRDFFILYSQILVFAGLERGLLALFR